MSCSRKAKDRTIDRLVNVGVTTVLLRLIDSTSYTRSFWSDYWQVSKEVVREDKHALPDAIKALSCWFGI